MRYRMCMIGACSAVLLCLCGCPVNLDDVSLSDTGTPFVLKGTAAVVDRDGPCPIWVGENGETYHLFQGTALDNDAYDQIIQPGVTSRLILATRSDLTLDCQYGVIVEVQDVLEVVE